MIGQASADTWAPIYDFDDLKRTIRDIVDAPVLQKRLYEPGVARDCFFQGDVVRLSVELPFIGPEAAPLLESPPPFWIVLGNTCDLDREIEEVEFTQLLPVRDLGPTGQMAADEMRDLVQYRYYTQFYLPPWPDGDDTAYMVDFLRPVTVHKRALQQGTVSARLTRAGWILFHCCVVRFLARDDGRNT